jgi:heat shock protein HtpX
MTTLYTHQDSNIRKTWLLMTVFLVLIIGVGWAFSAVYNAPEILIFAVVFSVVMNIGSYWWSDTIVIKLTGARPITRDSFSELWNIVENLSITAGLPMPKVYVMNEAVPNAYATGRNPEHAAVAVTTGLLQILEKNELEGVIAHELAHIGNRDILLSTVVVVLAGLIALLSDFFFRMSFFGGRDSDNKAGAIALVIGIVFAILAPIAATLIRLAVSRKREFLADASGALLTRYPEGLASALEKISAHSGKMKKASNATAHLFIANPFGHENKGTKTSFFAKIFMTHPPIEERIKALRGNI